MYLAHVRVELDEPLHPEQQNSLERIEMNVEDVISVSLQTRYDMVKVISVSVSLSCEHMGDDVFQTRWPL